VRRAAGAAVRFTHPTFFLWVSPEGKVTDKHFNEPRESQFDTLHRWIGCPWERHIIWSIRAHRAPAVKNVKVG
jgi:hypothetical protein